MSRIWFKTIQHMKIEKQTNKKNVFNSDIKDNQQKPNLR